MEFRTYNEGNNSHEKKQLSHQTLTNKHKVKHILSHPRETGSWRLTVEIIILYGALLTGYLGFKMHVLALQC